MRQSTTSVIARNEVWIGACATEPYEAGWASEIIIFLRTLEDVEPFPCEATIQISPDGIFWVDEGTRFPLAQRANAISFGRIAHFGNFVRLAAVLPEGRSLRVLVAVHAKS